MVIFGVSDTFPINPSRLHLKIMFLEIATRDSESRLFSDLISVKHGKNKK